MEEINITDAKNRLTEIIKEVETTTRSYSIFRSGHKAAILLSAEEYDSLLETIEVLQDRKLMKQILQSAKDFSQGKRVLFSKVRRDA